MEEAIRLREKHKDSIEQITVVTIGPPKAADILRTAMAMGADNAIHVETTEKDIIEPLMVAKGIREIVQQESPDMVLLGYGPALLLPSIRITELNVTTYNIISSTESKLSTTTLLKWEACWLVSSTGHKRTLPATST